MRMTSLTLMISSLSIACNSPTSSDDDVADTTAGDGDTSETAGDGDTTSETTTESDGDTTSETMGDGDGDGDGDACMSSAGTLRVDALHWDNEFLSILEDGVATNLPVEGLADGAYIQWVAARGSYIAGMLNTSIQMFDRQTKQLLWSTPNLQFPGTFEVSADGWVVFDLYSPDQEYNGLLINEGESHYIAQMPLSLVQDGKIAARESLPGGALGDIGWVTLSDWSWSPAQPPIADGLFFWSESSMVRLNNIHGSLQKDTTLEYVTPVEGALTFVRAAPNHVDMIPLPDMPLDYQTMSGMGPFRLLYSLHQSTTFMRIDIGSGEVLQVTPELPDGWSWFDCQQAREAAVDSSGQLLFHLHDTAKAQVWAYDPTSIQWTEVGLPFGLLDALEFKNYTYGDIFGVETFDTVLCPKTWEDLPPDNALLGETFQTMRRDPPLTMIGPVTVDAQQRCAASRDTEGMYRIQSLLSDLNTSHGWSGEWLWLD